MNIMPYIITKSAVTFWTCTYLNSLEGTFPGINGTVTFVCYENLYNLRFLLTW
jgi:hypothetical protein